ncbi:unnamed protein product [Urochloa humidicola]
MASDKINKVCVVGAGMSGFAAARELRCEGLAVTVMEQRGDVGGQWLYDSRTDADDPLGVTAPVKFHSSVYTSVRLISPRECMGFSDFQFAPRPGAAGRDVRQFPGHREVYYYLKDFCAAFGLADAVRHNTRVVHVAMVPPRDDASCGGAGSVKWQVTSVRVEPGGGEAAAGVEEVFDAVVVASGHYWQPRLPSIKGMEMEAWRRRQLHSHTYRTPDPFRGEVVVVVGCGESGLDIATELCGLAKEVHLVAKFTDDAAGPAPAVAKLLTNHASIRLRPPVEKFKENGTVEFADGSSTTADAVIYCTGYRYSFPFLDTAGAVGVDASGSRVGPLYEHTFPPALTSSLSFVGVTKMASCHVL